MIRYVEGDATYPLCETDTMRVIAHVCNDIGAWGADFVLALDKRWGAPRQHYRHKAQYGLILGEVQFVHVEPNIVVANMVAQHNIRPINGVPPIRYDALELCLYAVTSYARGVKGSCSVHMPRIGCGHAGGSWDMVGPIIQKTLVRWNVRTYVYDLPKKGV